MKYITTLLCILGFSIQTNAQNFGDVSALEGLNGKVLSIRQYFKSPDSSVSSKNQNFLITFRPDGKYTARYWLKNQTVDTYDLFYHTEDGTRYAKTNFSKDGEPLNMFTYVYDTMDNCTRQSLIHKENRAELIWDNFGYDNLNRRITQEAYKKGTMNDSALVFKLTINYENPEGKAVKSKIKQNKDGETISEIHYKNDQSGNPLQITVKNKSGETINIKKYQYEYDNQNNWIRCIETDDNNNVLTERQRDIIYQ